MRLTWFGLIHKTKIQFCSDIFALILFTSWVYALQVWKIFNLLTTNCFDTRYATIFISDKNKCNICDAILEGLELIDDECDVFGIHMVKIQDPQLAKRYSIKTFPALIYFRNGNPLIFEGDMQNEQSVLEWLIDDDNRELADEIEEVNDRMLERLLDESSLLVVFFCTCFFSLWQIFTRNLLFFVCIYWRWRGLCRMWGNFGRIGTNWWWSRYVWYWFC